MAAGPARDAMAAGYAGAYPASYTRFAIWSALLTGTMPPRPAAALRAFVVAKCVTAVVVDPSFPGPWRALFATLGVRPIATGGVLFYRLRPPG